MHFTFLNQMPLFQEIKYFVTVTYNKNMYNRYGFFFSFSNHVMHFTCSYAFCHITKELWPICNLFVRPRVHTNAIMSYDGCSKQSKTKIRNRGIDTHIYIYILTSKTVFLVHIKCDLKNQLINFTHNSFIYFLISTFSSRQFGDKLKWQFFLRISVISSFKNTFPPPTIIIMPKFADLRVT